VSYLRHFSIFVLKKVRVHFVVNFIVGKESSLKTWLFVFSD